MNAGPRAAHFALARAQSAFEKGDLYGSISHIAASFAASEAAAGKADADAAPNCPDPNDPDVAAILAAQVQAAAFVIAKWTPAAIARAVPLPLPLRDEVVHDIERWFQHSTSWFDRAIARDALVILDQSAWRLFLSERADSQQRIAAALAAVPRSTPAFLN